LGSDLEQSLTSLLKQGRIEAHSAFSHDGEASYPTKACVIPPEDAHGWEAAVLDHYQAMVTTLCIKLRQGAEPAVANPSSGGSTYSFCVWNGHPMKSEVYGLLEEMRVRVGHAESYKHALGLYKPHGCSVSPLTLGPRTRHRGGWAAQALLLLLVRHAVHRLAGFRIGQRDAALFSAREVPLGEAVAAKAGQVHELDVLNIAALGEVLQEAAESRGFEFGT
jgi:hypothetical protein